MRAPRQDGRVPSTFTLATETSSSAQALFDLSLDINAHVSSMSQTAERAVAGVMTGQIGLGETVTDHARAQRSLLAAHPLDLLEELPARVRQFVRQALHVPGTARRVDHPGQVRLLDQDRRRVAGDAAREGVGQAERVVEGQHRHGLGAADAGEMNPHLLGIEGETGSHLVAVDMSTNRVIGFANYGKARSMPPRFDRELYALYILKEFQGAGIGSALVRSVAAHCRELGGASLFAWVLSSNPNRAFYERLGAVAVGQGQVSLGGENHDQTAYRWDNLAKLAGEGRFSA